MSLSDKERVDFKEGIFYLEKDVKEAVKELKEMLGQHDVEAINKIFGEDLI